MVGIAKNKDFDSCQISTNITAQVRIEMQWNGVVQLLFVRKFACTFNGNPSGFSRPGELLGTGLCICHYRKYTPYQRRAFAKCVLKCLGHFLNSTDSDCNWQQLSESESCRNQIANSFLDNSINYRARFDSSVDFCRQPKMKWEIRSKFSLEISSSDVCQEAKWEQLKNQERFRDTWYIVGNFVN